MDPHLEEAFGRGRAAREAGDSLAAAGLYLLGAALARAEGDLPALAYALRHVSDITRERGIDEVAVETAEEAVALYRELDGPALDLANALRVHALAVGASDAAAALPLWQEARALYALAGVQAGVDECEQHLPDA